MPSRLPFCLLFVATLASAWSLITPTKAELYINEIYFGIHNTGSEARDEYIELRGTPGMSLDNHYLLFIENEDNATGIGPAGQIDNIFDLNGVNVGSNGFVAMRQAGGGVDGLGPSLYPVAPGATDLLNIGTGPGFGSGPGSSSIGAEDDFNEGEIENGGFTAMLIRNDGILTDGEIDRATNRPTIAFDLDEGNDGLDHPTGREGWAILDAIGIHAEADEAVFGRTYAPITYGVPEIGQIVILPGGGFTTADPGLEPDSLYVSIDFGEIEYLGRWGNSTGQTEADWHVSNLTNNPGSGSSGIPDWRQSFTGDHGDLASQVEGGPPRQPTAEDGRLESTKLVPYGAKITDNLGAPNYITGDANGDGVVDAADYTVWRDELGTTGSESAHPEADHDHDFMVTEADRAIWAANYGSPAAPEPAPSGAIPEPSVLALLAVCGLAVACRR